MLAYADGQIKIYSRKCNRIPPNRPIANFIIKCYTC